MEILFILYALGMAIALIASVTRLHKSPNEEGH
jgi:hypothetical protein